MAKLKTVSVKKICEAGFCWSEKKLRATLKGKRRWSALDLLSLRKVSAMNRLFVVEELDADYGFVPYQVWQKYYAMSSGSYLRQAADLRMLLRKHIAKGKS